MQKDMFMNKKDTKYEDVHLMLKATGKTTFINFYHDFKDFSISDKYLCDKVYKESPTAKSPNQRYKIPRARQIFKTGQQIDALKIIINSKKMSSDIIEKAKKILAEEIALQHSNNDIAFINELNNGFEFEDFASSFEYDNQPQNPREKIRSDSSVYPRDKKVSFNALKKAKFLCEVDLSHNVFLRKNSKVTYTEPHHLIPLSAQKDFPKVNLDREQNIVSLCSFCHNLIHYGSDFESILKPLYNERKELLKNIGIEITYEQLKRYYE